MCHDDDADLNEKRKFLSQINLPSSKPRVILAVTGSVATIKTFQLLNLLAPLFHIVVAATNSSLHFLRSSTDRFYFPLIFTDQDEYLFWRQRGDPILHIELSRWAQVLLIAPLSANTLTKIACGLADNFVTSVARAWDFSKPFIVAPAMNTLMWDSPLTSTHLNTLKTLNIHVIHPASKVLMCGTEGMGAMASLDTILDAVLQKVSSVPPTRS